MKSESSRQDAQPEQMTMFVGRNSELLELKKQLHKPRTRGAANVLISGPGGIGKTALCETFDHAVRAECRVLWSKTWAGIPQNPFWAITQIARTLHGNETETKLASLFFEYPEEENQFDLFENTRKLFDEKADKSRLILIFDNLHEADPSSISLLQYLLQALTNPNIFIIVTSSAQDFELSNIFERTLELSPLKIAEVTEFYAKFLNISNHENPISALYSATGGIPLLMEQFDTSEKMNLDPTRPNLAAALKSFMQYRMSLKSLQEKCLLTSLAVLGSANYKMLSAMANIEPHLIQRTLFSDRFSSLVEHSADQDLVFYSQEMVRNAVLELIAPNTLHDLHFQASQVLTDFGASSLEIAEHFAAAGQDYRYQAAEKFYESALSAGNSLAQQDTILALQKSLRALEFLSDYEANCLKVAVLSQLTKTLWQTGRFTQATDAWDQAWTLATQLGDPLLIGKVSLGPRFGIDFSGETAINSYIRLQYALKLIPEEEIRFRTKLTAYLALAALVSEPESSPALARDAYVLAELAADPVSRAYALVAISASDMGPDTLQERLHNAREILSIAASTGERDLVPPGWFLLLGSLVENSDFDQLSVELRESAPFTLRFSELKDGRHALWYRTVRAIINGDIQSTELLLNQAKDIAFQDNDPDSMGVWAAQLCLLRWLQHDFEQATPIVLQAIHTYPLDPVWKAAHAWINSTQENFDSAKGIIATIGNPDNIKPDRNWLATINFLAESAVHIGDDALAEICLRLLRPYSGRVITIGLGIAFWGTVDRTLALLANFLGKAHDSVKYYRLSIHLCAKADAKPWLALSQTELAEFLLKSNSDQETRAEAYTMLLEAKRLCQNNQWPGICAKLDQVLQDYAVREPSKSNNKPAVSLEPETSIKINVLGKFSAFDASGQQILWSSKRARVLLKVLISHRGKKVHRSTILDTVWPSVPHSELSNRLSVALTAIRRGLDPNRIYPAQHLLQFTGEHLLLNHKNIHIDADAFLKLGLQGLQEESIEHVEAALNMFEGIAFADEFDAVWAEQLQEETLFLFRDLVEFATERTDPARASELYRAVIAVDEYFLPAHEGLVRSLVTLGAHHQSAAAEDRLKKIVEELSA